MIIPFYAPTKKETLHERVTNCLKQFQTLVTTVLIHVEVIKIATEEEKAVNES